MWAAGAGRSEEGTTSIDLAWALERARERSLEVYALDLTRPETGVPVVRVVVPGLRPWKPRFASGRLYDVPVLLGWRAEPLSEADLNPVPFPQ